MLEESVPCPLCGRPISDDLRGHVGFHRGAAKAFIDLLRQEGRPADHGDAARARILECDRFLAELERGAYVH